MSCFKVFGAPLDPAESEYSVKLKLAYIDYIRRRGIITQDFKDPYDAVCHSIQDLLAEPTFIAIGKVPTDSWLTPRPLPEDLPLLNTLNYSVFTDSGGCDEYSKEVERFVNEKVGDGIPVMIGVDHSASGGVIRALAERYGKENLFVAIFDSHLDAIPTDVRLKASKGFAERLGKSGEVFYTDRPDSYNAGTFLRYLVKRNEVEPSNVLLIGVADYPTKEPYEYSNPYARQIADEYRKVERAGVKVIPKEELKSGEVKDRLRRALADAKPYLYISLDVDVCAYSAVFAARFMDLVGLDESDFKTALSAITTMLEKRETKLVGLDVVEIDIHLAGIKPPDKPPDRTIPFAEEFLRTLFNAQKPTS